MTTSTFITADEFSSMSFDMPTELVRGELVEMTNPGGVHGTICFNCAGVLYSWIRRGAEFRVSTNDTGVLTTRDPDSVRGPDLLVIQTQKLPGGRVPKEHFSVAPDVVVEVKSPSDRWPDVLRKVAEFLAAGISEVWVIDPEHFRLHAFEVDHEPSIFNREDELTSSYLPDFRCSLNELFAGIE